MISDSKYNIGYCRPSNVKAKKLLICDKQTEDVTLNDLMQELELNYDSRGNHFVLLIGKEA